MVEEHLDCSYAKANNLVEQFMQLGLVEEITGWQRNRRYRFKPYLALFEDEATGTPAPLSKEEEARG